MPSRELVAGLGHVVPVWYAQSQTNTAIAGDYIKMQHFDTIVFMINIGTVTAAGDGDFTVVASDDNAGGSTATVATLNFRGMTTTDTWSALTQVTDSKIDFVASGDVEYGSNVMIEIYVRGADIRALSATVDYKFITCNQGATGGGKSIVSSCNALLLPTGRYVTDVPVTAIA